MIVSRGSGDSMGFPASIDMNVASIIWLLFHGFSELFYFT